MSSLSSAGGPRFECPPYAKPPFSFPTAPQKVAKAFFLANPGEKDLNGPHGASGVPDPAPTRPWNDDPEKIVRLSRKKIEYLSDRILHLMQEDARIHPDANVDLVVRAIDDAIYENMQLEEEIDEEVEELVQENSDEIRAMEMDVGALRNKIKREIARKRGFVM
jgi:hypothetical protein